MSEQMRLSEAIRLGAMLKPQGFGHPSVRPEAEASCALGAAYDATGVNRGWNRLVAACPILSVIAFTACPVCGRKDESPIPHLNDNHRWTREQIADWVQTIEDAQATPATSREEVGTEQETVTASVAHSAPK